MAQFYSKGESSSYNTIGRKFATKRDYEGTLIHTKYSFLDKVRNYYFSNTYRKVINENFDFRT